MKKTRFLLILTIILSVLFSSAYAVTGSKEVEIGALIQYGRYNDKPILWVVTAIDDAGNLTVVSKNSLTIKAFDAAGDKDNKDDTYSYAVYYGSNRWEDSSLRTWLNATQKNVKWSGQAPNAKNIFSDENAYDDEAGFLSKENFSKAEVEAINLTEFTMASGTVLNDRIFLLTAADYISLSKNDLFYPLMMPTVESINLSDYKGFDLKLGQAFSVWTRDASDNPYAKHAVITVSGDGTEAVGVANTGRYGVMPAMTLNGNKLAASEVVGDGTSGNPLKFQIKSELKIGIGPLILLAFVAMVALVFWLAKRFNLPKLNTIVKRLLIFIALVALALVFIAFVAMPLIKLIDLPSKELSAEDTGEATVIIQSYALNQEVIENRLEALFKEDKGLILDAKGEDVTDAFLDKYGDAIEAKSNTEWIKTLTDDGLHLLYPGDYRVTYFASEVQGVMDGIHYVVRNEEADFGYQFVDQIVLTASFMKEIHDFYEKKDYDAIKDYLESRGLTIRHPSDTSNIGIPLLFFQERFKI